MSKHEPLHYSRQGQGPALIILHGLFGSGSNWNSQAKRLAGQFDVILPDLRNHGRSFHAPAMSYADLAGDVRGLMDALALETALVLGHSMGGKTAMTLALESPERVRALAVADIAPVAYHGQSNRPLIEAMQRVDLGSVGSRGDADAALAADVPQRMVRQFLLTNLQFKDDSYSWRIPLDILAGRLQELEDFPAADASYQGPTLFLYGAESNYVTADAHATIRRYFPAAQLHAIPQAGHWLHAEQPQLFADALQQFLSQFHDE
jgi:pimeloyl-ACP methyl ester carboxylesterase